MLDADRTDLGRLFQAIGPAVANACWPKLVRVLGTIRSDMKCVNPSTTSAHAQDID